MTRLSEGELRALEHERTCDLGHRCTGTDLPDTCPALVMELPNGDVVPALIGVGRPCGADWQYANVDLDHLAALVAEVREHRVNRECSNNERRYLTDHLDSIHDEPEKASWYDVRLLVERVWDLTIGITKAVDRLDGEDGTTGRNPWDVIDAVADDLRALIAPETGEPT